MQDAELSARCQVALFTLGEVALLREVRVPGGAAVKVQALTAVSAAAVGSRGRAGPAAAQVSGVRLILFPWCR